MNIPNLYKLAREGRKDSLKEEILKDNGKLVQKALKVAEKKNDFQAIATLKELSQDFPYVDSDESLKGSIIFDSNQPPNVVETVVDRLRRFGNVVIDEGGIYDFILSVDGKSALDSAVKLRGVVVTLEADNEESDENQG